MEEVIDFKAVDDDGWNCLMLACERGDLDRLKYLMDKGGSLAVFDDSGNSCLHIACVGKHFDVVKYLLDEGMDVNILDDGNFSPLHYACVMGPKLNILEILLREGAEVKARNKYGHTPFMCLCHYGDKETKL